MTRASPTGYPRGHPLLPRGSPAGELLRAAIHPRRQRESPFYRLPECRRVGSVIQPSDKASRRLSDVGRARPGDVTLQNILGVLVAKLDSCRRLPVFAFEASNEGHAECAQAFRDLADAERESLDELLGCLEQHLADTSHLRKGIRP